MFSFLQEILYLLQILNIKPIVCEDFHLREDGKLAILNLDWERVRAMSGSIIGDFRWT